MIACRTLGDFLGNGGIAFAVGAILGALPVLLIVLIFYVTSRIPRR